MIWHLYLSSSKKMYFVSNKNTSEYIRCKIYSTNENKSQCERIDENNIEYGLWYMTTTSKNAYIDIKAAHSTHRCGIKSHSVFRNKGLSRKTLKSLKIGKCIYRIIK